MSHFYRAFGLSIDSEVALPSLLPGRLPADISIRYGHQLRPDCDADTSIFINGHTVYFHIPQIARFRITRGHSIEVEPETGAAPQSIRLYLLGTAIGALLHQRGLLVLHANAIRFGDHCIAFAGHSGMGKSTLAAAFMQQGQEILSDDLVAIDPSGMAHPSYPQIKLWQDSANELQVDTATLRLISLERRKYACPLSNQFCQTALPLKTLYILNTHNHKDTRMTVLHGKDKLLALQEHTYRPQLIDGMQNQPQHLLRCGDLARRIDIKNLYRPAKGFDLEQMTDRIREDLSGAAPV